MDRQTLLLTLTGRDRPGVTSRLFEACAAFGVDVLDIEQVVLRGRLVLGVLITAPPDRAALRAAALGVAAELGVDLEITPGEGDNRARGQGRTHVTVLGMPLRPAAVAAVAGRIAATGGNIDRIVRMARVPMTAIDLDVSGAPPDELRLALAREAAEQGVDIAVQSAGMHRRAQRLIVMDVDSTLIRGEVIELLAARVGRLDEVSAITESAMAGELDFAESLRQRVALLAGLDVAILDQVYDELVYTPGAHTLVRSLSRLGYRFALVSGGFGQVIARIAADLGVAYYAANELEVVDGFLTGRLLGEIVDRAGKAAALRRFAADAQIPLVHTVAIGDGANDLDMLALAGLGIAFDAKPIVRASADASVTLPYLDAIIYLLGITREEVEAADAAADSGDWA